MSLAKKLQERLNRPNSTKVNESSFKKSNFKDLDKFTSDFTYLDRLGSIASNAVGASNMNNLPANISQLADDVLVSITDLDRKKRLLLNQLVDLQKNVALDKEIEIYLKKKGLKQHTNYDKLQHPIWSSVYEFGNGTKLFAGKHGIIANGKGYSLSAYRKLIDDMVKGN